MCARALVQANPFFIDQVRAMEAAAQSIAGVPPLRYIYPGVGDQGLRPVDKRRARNLKLPIERILTDLHVGTGGAVAQARALFAADPFFKQGVANLETNAMTHDLGRALAEAADLLEFFTAEVETTNRIWARTASFCSASAAQFDRADQGLSFFNQNASWLQPPGHVHAMISETWAEQTLRTEAGREVNGTDAPSYSIAAQRSLDNQLVIRAVNAGNHSRSVELTMQGGAVNGGPTRMLVLHGDSAGMDNTLGSPFNVAPVAGPGPRWGSGGKMLRLSLPRLSFMVVVSDLVE